MRTGERRPWRRVAGWAAGLLVVGVLVAFAVTPRAIVVDLAPVARGDLRVTLDHEGQTRVRHRYVVSAPVAGRVMRIDLEPGTKTEAGKTVVAVFRPAAPALLDVRTRREAQARVQAAETAVKGATADLARARTEREQADRELRRTRGLAQSGEVTPQDLEAAETQARMLAETQAAAEYALRTAEHDLEAARSALIEVGTSAGGPELEIRAPVTGLVLQRLQESEAVVPAGEPLVEIADPRDLEVVSDYLSTDAVQMQPAMPVEIDQWGGGAPLRGAVRQVEPHGFTKVSALGVEEQRVNVITGLVDPWPDWRALGDGYRVETHVLVWGGRNVLKLPVSSLFRRGDHWAVFADEHGRAVEKIVTIGRRTGLEAELLHGLVEGARVVLHPPASLSAGARIAPGR
jgi:HlyD family secretion protein